MKIKQVFDLIFSDENLYAAIQDASKGRRYHRDVLRVQNDCWNVIEQIQQDVRSGNYEIDRYYIFYVYEPKKRMIMSISFYHRIVQWAIYRVINPLLVKGYIEDSYGCIPGKGALSAMLKLRYWLKAVEKKPGTWYYLKLDISKYFYRISHRVLKKILAKKIKDERLLQILYSIIECRHTPFGLPPGKGPGDVPMEERLYDVGMPVGNLMSQVFANVYLDVLDQFCKRVLHIHFYVRYMDDIIILSDSKVQLHEWKNCIQEFLERELELSLNQKTCIRPVSQGIEFVGYRVWPHYVTIRKSTTLQIKRAMRLKVYEYNVGLTSMEDVTNTLKCYTGMLDHCDCGTFRDDLVCSVVLNKRPDGIPGDEVGDDVENYIEAVVGDIRLADVC
ncbi:MAG: RNA-directed DNA polymerase [Clostridiales bacterium]|nr:RNA-directed DNA polymerase [Clostridiales bacterium]